MPPKRNESFDYASLKVVELKALLKEKGHPVSGKKVELVERLKNLKAKVDKPKSKSKVAKKKCRSNDDDCLCFRKKSEIVKIAVEKLGIEEKQAKKYTVNKLCDILNNDQCVTKDISGFDIKGLIGTNPLKKWIKTIPTNNTVLFSEYKRNSYFTKIADILLDDDIKPDGTKKRNTLIKFVPSISNKDFDEKAEWLYIFTINGRIVKIGGTRTGLKGRIVSYMCGHHISERGKSGDCSKTNGFIYNTFEFYLNLNCNIEMFGYKIPKTEISIKIFDTSVNIVAQTFHAYESTFLEDYKKDYKMYPILSDNCDPQYK